MFESNPSQRRLVDLVKNNDYSHHILLRLWFLLLQKMVSPIKKKMNAKTPVNAGIFNDVCFLYRIIGNQIIVDGLEINSQGDVSNETTRAECRLSSESGVFLVSST